MDIDAETVGHDLAWGTARFTRHTAEKDDQARTAQDFSDSGREDLPDDVDPITGELTGTSTASADVGPADADKEPALAGAEAPF